MRWLCLLCFVSSGFVSAAETAVVGTKAPNVPGNDPVVLYAAHCAICHGDNGDAQTRVQSGLRPPPRDFTSVASALELNRKRMIASVTNGVPGTGMMPHKDRLTKQQIGILVDYIQTKFMRTPDNKQVTTKNMRGEKIYTRHCSVCHGDKGNTAYWAKSGLNPPPRNFTDPTVGKLLTRERMLTSVTKGRPGTGMMPFSSRLDKSQIEAVVDYIKTAFIDGRSIQGQGVAVSSNRGKSVAKQPRQTAGAGVSVVPPKTMLPASGKNPHQPGFTGSGAKSSALPTAIAADMSLPFPNGLIGDAKQGKAFFLKNCFTCHGTKGGGDGPRSHFIIPRPRDFTSQMSRQMFNRVRLFSGITKGRTGTVMPAWGKVLSDQQIADVAEFVFVSFIQATKSKSTKSQSTTSQPKKAASTKKKKQ